MADQTGDGVRVTMTVTVTMTRAQRDAYAETFGVGFVGAEVANRLRREAAEALNLISWLREYGTVEISKPKQEPTP